MAYFYETTCLTDKAVLTMLNAAVDKASEMGQPQCIVIVDASGVTLAEMRMTGAKFLSLKTARAKALTAASIQNPSHAIPDAVRNAVGMASHGDITGLEGGLPIRHGSNILGGIGVGSGTPAQDTEVAKAALSAIGLNSRKLHF